MGLGSERLVATLGRRWTAEKCLRAAAERINVILREACASLPSLQVSLVCELAQVHASAPQAVPPQLRMHSVTTIIIGFLLCADKQTHGLCCVGD